jgi:DDE superfamily endonuclease
MTKGQYVEYLLATPGNYTCTNLADHLEGAQAQSHDAISDFLRSAKLTPRGLWHVVQPLLQDSPESYLIFDDSVQDKRYSHKIELVKLQYSGAEGGLVRGIGVLNLLHSSGAAADEGDFYPVDYRIYDPDGDGKTKNQHFREMLVRAVSDKGLQATTILFDSWYASLDNLKLIQRLKRFFVTTLKSNRLVSVSKEEGFVHLPDVEWTPERLQHGVLVKLKNLPFQVRLFKIVAPNGDIEWLITNRSHTGEGDGQVAITAQDVKKQNALRWQIEQLHRELKQLTGSEKCQCRKARSQRNHLSCCYLAWVSLKVHARRLEDSLKVGITLYSARKQVWEAFLRTQLRNPTIVAHAC